MSFRKFRSGAYFLSNSLAIRKYYHLTEGNVNLIDILIKNVGWVHQLIYIYFCQCILKLCIQRQHNKQNLLFF